MVMALKLQSQGTNHGPVFYQLFWEFNETRSSQAQVARFGLRAELWLANKECEVWAHSKEYEV